MKREYKVYCHTCKINGKRYIGCTCRKPEDRWDNGNGYCGQSKFYADIQKYGWDNFDHEVVFDHMDKETAFQMEEILIREFDTVDNGYNSLTSGIKGHVTFSADVKTKISNAKMGHPTSEITKHKISQSLKGHYVSEKTRRAVSEAHKGHAAPNRRKMINKETGETYESLAALAKIVGTGSSNIIYSMNNPNSKYFKYAYLEE